MKIFHKSFHIRPLGVIRIMNLVAFNVETNKYYDDNENRFDSEVDFIGFNFIWIAIDKTEHQQAGTSTAWVRIESLKIQNQYYVD